MLNTNKESPMYRLKLPSVLIALGLMMMVCNVTNADERKDREQPGKPSSELKLTDAQVQAILRILAEQKPSGQPEARRGEGQLKLTEDQRQAILKILAGGPKEELRRPEEPRREPEAREARRPFGEGARQDIRRGQDQRREPAERGPGRMGQFGPQRQGLGQEIGRGAQDFAERMRQRMEEMRTQREGAFQGRPMVPPAGRPGMERPALRGPAGVGPMPELRLTPDQEAAIKRVLDPRSRSARLTEAERALVRELLRPAPAGPRAGAFAKPLARGEAAPGRMEPARGPMREGPEAGLWGGLGDKQRDQVQSILQEARQRALNAKDPIERIKIIADAWDKIRDKVVGREAPPEARQKKPEGEKQFRPPRDERMPEPRGRGPLRGFGRERDNDD
jgi:predicted Fe-S protein YdhL (DUF1289 family)